MVLDASAVVELLIGSARGEAVARAIRRRGGDAHLHAPDLVDIEVAHVLRRYAAQGALAEGRAEGAIELLERMPLTRHPARTLLPRIWMLRETLTAYDGAYVALAEALDAALLTCDGRLARAPGHGAEVVVP